MKYYNAEARWTEIQFLLIFSDIFSVRNNFEDSAKLIDLLAMFGEFDIIKIKNLANQIIMLPNVRPSKHEFAILATIMDVPSEYILRKAGISLFVYRRMKKQQKKDPVNFYHALEKHELTEISKFLDCWNTIRKVGAPSESSRRTVETIQGLRYGCINNVPLRFS